MITVRILILIGLTVVLLAGAVGCSPAKQDNGIASAGGVPSTTAVAVPGDNYDAARWTRCLREHGIAVDDPDPSDPAGGKPNIHEDVSTKEQVDAAAEACRAYNPNWGKPAAPPDPAEIDRMRAFARCMRDHGIDWDDPDPHYQTPAEVPPPGSETKAGEPTPSGPSPN